MASVAPVAAKAASVSAGGIAEARPGVRVSTTDWATSGSVNSRRKSRRSRSESGHPRRNCIGDA